MMFPFNVMASPFIGRCQLQRFARYWVLPWPGGGGGARPGHD